MKDFIDRHHLIWVSRWWLTVAENIINVRRRFHNAIHALFDNRTPVWQLEFVMSLNAQSLSRDFNKRFIHLISEYSWEWEQYAYKNWLFIPERLLEAQQKYKK